MVSTVFYSNDGIALPNLQNFTQQKKVVSLRIQA
jgi:hypothetical protein